MAEKIFKVRIPDGYEIDEEKSTFEKIVFKELDYKSLYETLKERIQGLHGAGIISDSNYRDLFRKDPPKKKIKSSPKSKITSKFTTRSKKIKPKLKKVDEPIGSLFDKYGIPYELAYDSTFDKCWHCPLYNREGDHDLCEYIKNPENTSDVIDWEDYEDNDVLDFREFCREVCDNEIPSIDSEGKLKKFLKNNLIKNIPEDFATQGEVDREFERVFGKETTKKKTKSNMSKKVKPKSKSKKVDEPIKSKSKVKSEEIKGDYNTFIGWINNCTSFYQRCYEGYTFPTHDGYEVRDFLPEGLGYKEDGVDIPYNDPEGIDSYFEDWFDDFKEDMGDKFMTYTEYLKQFKK